MSTVLSLRKLLVHLAAAGVWAGSTLAGPETWVPVGGMVPAGGFAVDRQNRMESLSFYNGVYLASEGAATRIGWTGVLNTCTVGTTAPAFREDVRRRVNYYQ